MLLYKEECAKVNRDKILEIESQLQEVQGNNEEHKKRISAFIQRMQAYEKVKPQSKDVSKYSTEDFPKP